jgi:cell shape-determining protein MreD
MSNSQHPRALSVERWVSDSTRLLAVVLFLPLVDGVFVAVVLGGALDSIVGILEVGLLVFGGSAMVAVILAEMNGSPRQSMGIVLAIGSVVIAVAGIQAALAPTIESAIDMVIFERFAALVILAIAASTASAKIGEYLPGPALIIGLGFLATLSPSEATLVVQTDPELVVRAMAAASVGVGFGLVLAATRPWLRNVVELDRFRFGSAVALGVLAVSIAGFLPSEAPVALLVLGMTALLAFDPSGQADNTEVESPFESATADEPGRNPDPTVPNATPSLQSSSADQPGSEPVQATPSPTPVSDGGPHATDLGPSAERGPDGDIDSDGVEPARSTTGTSPGQERPPWL